MIRTMYEEVFDTVGRHRAGGRPPSRECTGVKDPADEDTLYGEGRSAAAGGAYGEVTRQPGNPGRERFMGAGPWPHQAAATASDSEGVDAE
ncbi:hypothetical protein [Streptomyces sp. I4(2020)]|uniref:hypothetical protein n=1 Tax=Streptomyces sp. I4(2020) TaxID=2760981 RepID=UPI0018EE51BB|nr:hypothetical protein [Streptomyces sp. I4(2020)]MBJ6613082.1 hypothetical protein [Streptomyces sp. I3(2020)]MBJ6623980.1 hypothetical protein [Streptomyces sp. I4(2020)]